ncbi:DUF3060 domain-containing protein [Terriglobus aquaticus]|uniref:DUF3060 domain-containing protein n=1 Tax=Terriglobus aquaticus TaxID=940139 RepID=A0ABW9KGL9_9BACT|nr:DUF3060 domain-containing protein [Terriglobus aquaticus]
MRTSLLLLVAASFATAGAQRRIEPPNYEQPSHSDVVLAGNQIRQTVTCTHGNAVYVQGQWNVVEVGGDCRFVRVQGNHNHLFVRSKSPIHVEGNENLIEVTDADTPFSERGEQNRFERRGR